MLFTEPAFTFFFLPILFVSYFLIAPKYRNLLLLLFSLYFYAVGEPKYVLLMLGSCGLNYGLALAVENTNYMGEKRLFLGLAIISNLTILGIFKYTNFVITNLNFILSKLGISQLNVPSIILPIGISFFTFQAMSYVIDVYRQEVKAQKNPIHVALYISLFPQLIAGPIVRYQEISEQIKHRFITIENFSNGINRFVIGLGKKVIIANTVAFPADKIFSIPSEDLTFSLSWLGIICYTLQIYFDFSGYSDMAIGLGKMFGFNFPENFNYPYISKSVTDFWRRWHISLSSWFRDYLYIPLGGNRVSPTRLYLNLLVVFFLCGLWHGASNNFIIWGLFHGIFLIFERLKILKLLFNKNLLIQHFYLLLVVMVGWVFFRVENLSQALEFIKAMFGFSQGTAIKYHVGLYLNSWLVSVMIAAIITSTPIIPTIQKKLPKLLSNLFPQSHNLAITIKLLELIPIIVIFIFSSCSLAAGTYNPFIYFRF